MRTRSGVRALALTTAGTVVLTGCLGGGGGGGGGGAGGDGEVEIMYGFANEQSEMFQDKVQAWADEEGINVKFSATPDFDKLVRSRCPATICPTSRSSRSPASRSTSPGRASSPTCATCSTRMRSRSRWSPASSRPRPTRTAPSSPPRCRSASRASSGTPSRRSRRRGPTVPTTPRGTARADRADQGRRDRALVHRHRGGPATGWPATDWVEDYVLRIGGTEVYDQWDQPRDPVRRP